MYDLVLQQNGQLTYSYWNDWQKQLKKSLLSSLCFVYNNHNTLSSNMTILQNLKYYYWINASKVKPNNLRRITYSNKTLKEYIVHGSKNRNDSKLKLTLERVSWNDATFRSVTTYLGHALVVCDLTQIRAEGSGCRWGAVGIHLHQTTGPHHELWSGIATAPGIIYTQILLPF